jgi:Icc-related predicted phosphoesterase
MSIVNENTTYTLFFTSDLHGNAAQYTKLFSRAQEEKVNAVIIGGDIAPKSPSRRTIQAQRDFLEHDLFPLIVDFHRTNRIHNHACAVYIMMGNDDYKANYPLLQEKQEAIGYYDLHNACFSLNGDFTVLGYAYVPITPFLCKDWEKPDLVNEDERLTRKRIRIKGVTSETGTFVDTRLDLANRKDSIETDLRQLLSRSNPASTLLVSHTPPYGTCLDLIDGDEHVGSRALRKLIEEIQPLVTLHGHLHETVDISGKFIDRIGKTVCIGSGNSELPDSPCVIRFNPYRPEEAKREVIR